MGCSLCLATFAAGVRQMVQNPLETEDTATTELVTLQTADEIPLLFWLSRDCIGWAMQVMVKGPQACQHARHLELYMNYGEGFGEAIGVSFPSFDGRLRHWSTHTDVTGDMYEVLQRMVKSDECPCGRSRKPSGKSLCSRCLIEGVQLLEQDCPICMQALTSLATKTTCCLQAAHQHCLSRTERCFNCRHEPLTWL